MCVRGFFNISDDTTCHTNHNPPCHEKLQEAHNDIEAVLKICLSILILLG